MEDLSSEQKSVIRGVQERKSLRQIATDEEIKERTVYRIAKGLSAESSKVPKKYQTEKQYLRKLDNFMEVNQKLSSGYTVAVEGFRVLEKESITVEVDEQKVKLDECKICGFDDKDCLHRHHIIPKSQGGSDDESNIIVLCANCHAKVHRLILKGVNPQIALEKVAGKRIAVLKEGFE